MSDDVIVSTTGDDLEECDVTDDVTTAAAAVCRCVTGDVIAVEWCRVSSQTSERHVSNQSATIS